MLFHHNDAKTQQITLKAICGPDDDASPSITVMMQREY